MSGTQRKINSIIIAICLVGTLTILLSGSTADLKEIPMMKIEKSIGKVTFNVLENSNNDLSANIVTAKNKIIKKSKKSSKKKTSKKTTKKVKTTKKTTEKAEISKKKRLKMQKLKKKVLSASIDPAIFNSSLNKKLKKLKISDNVKPSFVYYNKTTLISIAKCSCGIKSYVNFHYGKFKNY
jgi:hypothetical protein